MAVPKALNHIGKQLHPCVQRVCLALLGAFWRAFAVLSAAREASAWASFFATSRWACALSCWGASLLAEPVMANHDANNFLGFAYHAFDDASAGFDPFAVVLTHD
jgi:hypothetical protein